MARDNKGFMLLTECDAPFERDGWISQIKFDGRRVQVEKKGDSVIFKGRDNIQLERFPEVIETFKKIRHDFIVDSEFCCFEKDGIKTELGKMTSRSHTKDAFKIKVMSKIMPVQPAIFDLLEIDGNDMRNEPYEKRKQALQEAFSGVQGVKVVRDFDRPLEAWEFAQKHELEGIVERDKSAPYIEGRSDRAVKVKRKEITVIRFDGYQKNPTGITLTDSVNGLRCACQGQQHHKVKNQIDKEGFTEVRVNSMAGRTTNNKLREITFHSYVL